MNKDLISKLININAIDILTASSIRIRFAIVLVSCHSSLFKFCFHIPWVLKINDIQKLNQHYTTPSKQDKCNLIEVNLFLFALSVHLEQLHDYKAAYITIALTSKVLDSTDNFKTTISR